MPKRKEFKDDSMNESIKKENSSEESSSGDVRKATPILANFFSILLGHRHARRGI